MRRFSCRVSLVAGLIATMAAGSAVAADGAQLYAANCSVCHQPDGAGAPGVAPPLRTDLWKRLGSQSPSYLAGVLVSGLVGMPIDGQRYGAAMPSWAQLSDAELSAVGTFVLQKLNGVKSKVPEAAVKEARKLNPGIAALGQLRDGG